MFKKSTIQVIGWTKRGWTSRLIKDPGAGYLEKLKSSLLKPEILIRDLKLLVFCLHSKNRHNHKCTNYESLKGFVL